MPELHFISGWGVPVSAWGDVIEHLASHVHMTVYEAAAWKTDPPPPVRGAYLGGWSLGAQLAMAAAAAHPETWRGLLLLSATARFCRDADQPWGSPPRHLDRMSRKLASAPSRVLNDFYDLCAAPHPQDPATRERWSEEAQRGGTAPLQDGLRHLKETDLRPLAAGITLPAALLHGRDDRVVPWESGAWLAQNMPQVTSTFLDHEGHDLPLRRPLTVLDSYRQLAERTT